MSLRKTLLLRAIERVRDLVKDLDLNSASTAHTAIEREILAELESAPMIELRSWLTSPTSTRWRRRIALLEIRRRETPASVPDPAPAAPDVMVLEEDGEPQ